MTSHLDIAPTLLPLIGIKNPAEDVCLGHNLFGQEIRRYTVVSDWSRIGYVGEKYKAIFPFKSGDFTQNRVTTMEDRAVENDSVFFQENRDTLVNVMLGLSKFRLKK